MRFLKGQTQSEIATELGISQMHVSRLLTRRPSGDARAVSTMARGSRCERASATPSSSLPGPEYLLLARLALTGVGRLAQADEEALADLRLAVTEAAANACRHAYEDGEGQSSPVQLTLGDDHQLEVVVEDNGPGFDEGRRWRSGGAEGPRRGRHGPRDHPCRRRRCSGSARQRGWLRARGCGSADRCAEGSLAVRIEIEDGVESRQLEDPRCRCPWLHDAKRRASRSRSRRNRPTRAPRADESRNVTADRSMTTTDACVAFDQRVEVVPQGRRRECIDLPARITRCASPTRSIFVTGCHRTRPNTTGPA